MGLSAVATAKVPKVSAVAFSPSRVFGLCWKIFLGDFLFDP